MKYAKAGRSWIFIVVISVFAVWFSQPSIATDGLTFTVNSTFDAADINPGDGACDAGETLNETGRCTLRAAIQEANAYDGEDRINIPSGTYVLERPGADEDAAATGDLDIVEDVVIVGAVGRSTVIDGNGLDRVLHVLEDATVVLMNVRIQKGEVNSSGGGILNEGTLELVDISVMNNAAAVGGGGLFNGDTMTLNQVTVFDNIADLGGGIVNVDTMMLDDVEISKNVANSNGGGVFNLDEMMLSNVKILDNFAKRRGGGIDNLDEMELSHVIISQNFADEGGGIHSDDTVEEDAMMRLNQVIVSENTADDRGGGIVNGSRMSLTNVIVSENIAEDEGGGIINSLLMELVNVTISDNTADEGAGIYNEKDREEDEESRLEIVHATISNNVARNEGGGIYNADSDVEIKNTLLSNNTGNCVGTFASLGHNLSSDDSCVLFFDQATDINNVDPLLGPLANNGGFTRTQLLRVGSPALDVIPVVACTDLGGRPVSVDQRDVTRPQNTYCDIGALETEPSSDQTDTPTPTTVAQALDENDNNRLDDDEVTKAIGFWITGATVPEADRVIDDRLMLELIQMWITGTPVDPSSNA